MGRVRLVSRLAARDLRHRPLQAVLLLIVLTVAMATLTLGLVLHGVTSKPYQQTRAATSGPDVVASSVGFAGPRQSAARVLSRLAALAHAPGVAASSGPYPVAWPVLRANGITAEAMAEGRGPARAGVDRPEILQGTWVRPGGVVVERAFADALGLHVGDHVTVDGRRFPVIGIAVTTAVPVFSQVCFYGGCSGPAGRPRSFDTGLIWVTEATARSLAAPGNPLTYYLNLRLNHPAAAPAFVTAHQPPPGPGPAPLTAWQSLRNAAATLVASERQILEPASWLLALLAVAAVAVVAGGRMAEQEKRVGLLKAAGGSPPLVAAVLLAQHLVIAVAGAGLGLAAGLLTAPLLASPGASLIGSPGAPPVTASAIVIVVAAAVAVAGASTVVPAGRAARISTVTALAGAARPPRRGPWLIRLSARLPVSLLLGLRLVTRRPRRFLLSAASFTVTATTVVAVLTYHATVSRDARISGPFSGAPDPGNGRVAEVLLVITVVMAILAAANAVFTTWATVLDSRRFSATVRALGASPEQSLAGLIVGQLLPALAGTVLGIPIGGSLYAAVQNGGPHGSPPAWWLLTMVAGILVTVTGLTAIPASLGIRRPVAESLPSELA
jgi:ABC-type lipoprotein release transport system permease subunit